MTLSLLIILIITSGTLLFLNTKVKKMVGLIFVNLLLAASLVGVFAMSFNLYQQISGARSTQIANTTVKVKDAKLNKITNEVLASAQNPSDLFNLYSKAGQDTINKLYGDNETSKKYGLSLIGKELPQTTLTDVNNNSVELSKDSLIMIINTGDKSKSMIEAMNNVKDSKLQLVVLMPNEKIEDAKKFAEENKLDGNWKIVAAENNDKTELRPELLKLVQDYFNVVGVPSYVAMSKNRVTIAGTGVISKSSFKNFEKQALTKPELYTLMAQKSGADNSDSSKESSEASNSESDQELK